jgi:hypothetical protein
VEVEPGTVEVVVLVGAMVGTVSGGSPVGADWAWTVQVKVALSATSRRTATPPDLRNDMLGDRFATQRPFPARRC